MLRRSVKAEGSTDAAAEPLCAGISGWTGEYCIGGGAPDGPESTVAGGRPPASGGSKKDASIRPTRVRRSRGSKADIEERRTEPSYS